MGPTEAHRSPRVGEPMVEIAVFDGMAKLLKKQRRAQKETLAKVLAPEEIRTGDFVAVLAVTYEFPSFFWSPGDFGGPAFDETVRVAFCVPTGGEPRKVLSVCLPFVAVVQPKGGVETLDVRRHRFARLKRSYAKIAWKALGGKDSAWR